MNKRLLSGLIAVAALALAASAFAASRIVVHTAENDTLGATVLVNTHGKTLYHLSVEKKGHFVCTGTCTKLWPPLVVAKGVTPAGAKRLATVKRPDGRLQVTYRGWPLYTFARDAAGDANGEGLKDVGVWHAAVVAGGAPAVTTETTTTTTSGDYGGGYGGGYGG